MRVAAGVARGILAAACACAGISMAVSPAAAEVDEPRFLSAFSDAPTIAQRHDLCAGLNPADTPGYLALFCEGYADLAAGKDSLAALLLNESLRLKPDFALGCVAYGDAYLERKSWPPAIEWYETAREIAPKWLDPSYGLGRVWLARAATEGAPAYEKALEAFREMVRVAPSSADGWNNVGMVLALLGRYDEADASYKEALKLTPNDPRVYYSLGSVASRRGDDAAAENYWTHALAIPPTYAPAATELAALLGRQGKVDDAVRVLEMAVQAAHIGADAGRLRRDLGLLSLLQDRTTRAETLLEEADTLDPEPRTQAALAHAKLLQGETDAACSLLAASAKQDSAVAGPFVRAWSGTLAPALAGYAARDAAGAALLRKLLPRTQPAEPGAQATRSLVQSVLTDWKLPEGKLAAGSATGTPDYDTPPTPIYRAMASYPETAAGSEGTIAVQVRVDTHGLVRDAKVIQGGNPALEWAALDAAKRWRFQPATRNGVPVEASVTIPFHFSAQ